MTPEIRMLAVGPPAEAGLRGSAVAGFRQSGCAVELLDLGPWGPAWLASAAVRRPALAARFRREIRRRVDASAEAGPVDLVLVFKGSFLNESLIDYLRFRFQGPVVCWNPDSPFDVSVSNRGAGIPKAIAAYDAYITWAEDVAERLSKLVPRVLVVPFAWDPVIMQPAIGSGVAADRIAFIGTGTRERVAWLRRLAHLRPVVFGYRWPSIEGIDIQPPVFGPEFSGVVGEARWNLNLLRHQNARSHNMRTFELVGADGTQVAPWTEDHQRFLGSDSRTVLFRDERELQAVLRSDPHEYPRRDPAVLDSHTYRDRARQILTALKIT
jgi:Glycosyl transferases group 1